MQVPEWLISLVYKCLEKKPGDRFANGVELHNQICHHRIYSGDAAVANLVNNEDHKWEAIIEEKDEELRELRTIIDRQQREIETLKRAQPVAVASDGGYNRKKGVSRSAFNALLLLLLLAGGVAVYSLFFSKSVVGGVQTENTAMTTDTTTADEQENNTHISENRSSAKDIERSEDNRKQQIADSIRKQTEDKKEKQETPPAMQDSTKKETTSASANEEATDKKDDEEESSSNAGSTRYKVRNKAFFHDEPDADTKRSAFIIHWNNAVLKPLDEKNGFIYIVFTNHLGQSSKGWLSKDDLIEVK